MKKIISIVLLLAVLALALVGCATPNTNNNNNENNNNENNNNNNENNTPTAAEYKLAVVVDEGLATVSKGGATVIALALVWDAEGKIVAARFDSVQPKFALNTEKTDIVAVNRVDTKVELADGYTGMSDSWKNEAAAFEAFLVGKTAADIAALEFVVDGADAGLVAGCTMKSSMPVFQALVAEAFAYERAVSFATNETITLGLAINCAVSGNVADGGKVTADVAGVAFAGDKVAAAMVDSMEGKYTLAIGEDQKLTVTLKEYKGTKNEQGDSYNMVTYGGAIAEWYVQAQAVANATVGKTATELDAIDATAIAGCTMYAGGYKAALVRAAGYAR